MINFAAPAKINLFLDVTGKRPDGYHDLITVMQKITLSDEISVQQDSCFSIETDSEELNIEPEKNLVFRLYHGLIREGVKLPGMKVFIKKKIPSGAGLGGGSSDAGTFYLFLEKELGISLGSEKKHFLASLGADISFFASEFSCALASGIGEKLEEIEMNSDFQMVLKMPDFKLATVSVYSCLKLQSPPEAEYRMLIDSLNCSDFQSIARNLYNELQYPAAVVDKRILDEIEKVKKLCYGPVMMSGSGSSIFGFRPFEHVAENAEPGVFRCSFLKKSRFSDLIRS